MGKFPIYWRKRESGPERAHLLTDGIADPPFNYCCIVKDLVVAIVTVIKCCLQKWSEKLNIQNLKLRKLTFKKYDPYKRAIRKLLETKVAFFPVRRTGKNAACGRTNSKRRRSLMHFASGIVRIFERIRFTQMSLPLRHIPSFQLIFLWSTSADNID